MSHLLGSWTLNFAWINPPAPTQYHSTSISFDANGTTSDGAKWTLEGNQISWLYDNPNNPNVYSGTIDGYAMVGTMSGSFNGGWFYAIKKDIPVAADGDSQLTNPT